MNLQKWANENEPAKSVNGFWHQVTFIRDEVAWILAETYDAYVNLSEGIRVISTHVSKSVRLPVYYVSLPDGTKFVLRNNFYDWKVSIDSPRDVDVDFLGLFDPTIPVGRYCCEGFPTESIFGAYANNRRQFTIELATNYDLYTFMWLFSHLVLGNRNKMGRGR